LVDNLARSPKGGDTDQIKGVASGECGVAVDQHLLPGAHAALWQHRRAHRRRARGRGVSQPVQLGYPHERSRRRSRPLRQNPDGAVKFLEYLASPAAQNHFANGNNEWPTVKGVVIDNPALKAMTGGSFKSELIPISAVGMNQIKVQQMLDRVGFR